jgi:hypothetical protein
MNLSTHLNDPHRCRRGFACLLGLIAIVVVVVLLPPASPAVQAQPKEPQLPQPAQPARTPGIALRTFEPAVQPSGSVEATALAIAYHALRAAGNDKPSAADIGKFAADMLNELSMQRK